MPDTPTSRADILVLFADNSIGAISEQDLRDFVVSVLGGYASIKIIAGVTAQTTTATPAKMTGFNTTEGSNGPASGLTADKANNEITADVAGTYRVEASVCFSGTVSKTFLVAFYVDTGGGYADAGAPRINRKLGTGGDIGASQMHADLSLSASDKVALYVWSSDGGTSFTPVEANLSAKRIG